MASEKVATDDSSFSEKEDPEKDPSNKWQKSCNLFLKIYLPLSFVIFIVFGALVPAPGVFFNHPATQYTCVICIFLNSGLYLRSSALKEVLKSYKGTIYGLIAILGLTPIVGGYLTKLLPFTEYVTLTNSSVLSNSSSFNESLTSYYNESLIGPFEYKVGLTLFFVLPCTVSSGIVMISQLNGHVALAIILTVTANIIGIFTVPLYINWMIATDANVKLNLKSLILKLCLTVLVPLAVGKLLRFVERIRNFMTKPKVKVATKILNITFIDIIAWTKISQTSANGALEKVTAVNTVFLISWALTVHIIYLLLNAFISWALRLPYDQKKTVIILASQKTLAVGVSVAAFLPVTFGEQGMIVIAMVIAQITIIVFDAGLIPCWLAIDSRYEENVEGVAMINNAI